MNGSINSEAKTCSCGSYLDVPSTMCSSCWEEYSQLLSEEASHAQMLEEETQVLEATPKSRLFVGSGEDVCLSDN